MQCIRMSNKAVTLGVMLCVECPGCGVQYSSNTQECHQSCGFLVSHGYPAGYNSNARYTWHITVQRGLYVELTFPQFDVYESPIQECKGDIVTVVDFTLQNEAIEIGK